MACFMDQKVAKKLFDEGAFLVLLDVPEKVEFGIDYNCWNVGPLFKGVKMIPPGLHFVFYRCFNFTNITVKHSIVLSERDLW